MLKFKKFFIPDPPTDPYASSATLLVVMLVTAIKQGYEDIKRHKEDRKVNNTRVKILRNGEFIYVKWKEIKCGDIVECLYDETFPCDLLLLYSKTEDGTCQIKTSNLDGETNLKLRTVPFKMPVFNSEQELLNSNAVIKCEKPNPRLHEFKGNIQFSKDKTL
jgi:phospholipid-transporting ATPase